MDFGNLVFGMTALKNYDPIVDYYLDVFNIVSKIQLKAEIVDKQMGGLLLLKFELAACGIARWQPSLPRAIKTIDAGIERASRLVDFWRIRDPQLFSFLE